MYAIWNLTDVCPWNCAFCCMSAKNLNANSLRDKLDIRKKIKILKILAANGVKIDFSGGDPLFRHEDFTVVEEATKILPKEKIDVSMTGYEFNKKKLHLLKKVGKVEISIDNVPGEVNPFRPKEFNFSAISTLETIAKEGIFCSAVTTLYPHTANKESLKKLFELLCEKMIPKWNILRFYPVGRGVKLSNLNLAEKELIEIMDFLDLLNGSTEIALQHSLRILRGEYQCHAAVKSIGILPDGTISACGWGLDENSRPLPCFELGKLPKDSLDNTLKKAREKMGYEERMGYCRIMKYLKEKEIYESERNTM